MRYPQIPAFLIPARGAPKPAPTALLELDMIRPKKYYRTLLSSVLPGAIDGLIKRNIPNATDKNNVHVFTDFTVIASFHFPCRRYLAFFLLPLFIILIMSFPSNTLSSINRPVIVSSASPMPRIPRNSSRLNLAMATCFCSSM